MSPLTYAVSLHFISNVVSIYWSCHYTPNPFNYVWVHNWKNLERMKPVLSFSRHAQLTQLLRQIHGASWTAAASHASSTCAPHTITQSSSMSPCCCQQTYIVFHIKKRFTTLQSSIRQFSLYKGLVYDVYHVVAPKHNFFLTKSTWHIRFSAHKLMWSFPHVEILFATLQDLSPNVSQHNHYHYSSVFKSTLWIREASCLDHSLASVLRIFTLKKYDHENDNKYRLNRESWKSEVGH